MTLYEALDDHDLRELLRSRGVVIDGQGKTSATWRGERTPSVQVYTDHWHDYGDADKRGDFLDWLEVIEGMSKEDAYSEAARAIGFTDGLPSDHRASIKSSAPRAQPQRAPVPPPAAAAPSWINDLVTQAHEALVRQESDAARLAYSYFEKRAITPLIDHLQLGVVDESVRVPQAGGKMNGLRGRAVIPTLEQGQPVWFKARYIPAGTDADLKAQGIAKYDGPSGTLPTPFNPAGLEHAASEKFLVLTEGELDGASLLVAYGPEYPVLGLSGGIPKGWDERISDTGAAVYIIMDPDDAGIRNAERYRAQLSGLGVRCYVVRLPGSEDLNSMLTREGPSGLAQSLNALLETATLESTSDLLYIRETWLAELDARARRPHNHYTTGLPALDELLGGGYLEGLHLIGGITGGGKTSFALHVALHNALEGRPVIYASYEQSRLELWGRIASRLTDVPFGAIKRGTYDDHGQKVLTSSQLKASEGWEQLELASKHLKIVEGGDALSRQASSYTIEVLADTAQVIAEERGVPPLIILDYLQRVPAPPEMKIKDVRERVGYASGVLQVRLARELQAPVLALSSIGRASYRLAEATIEERLAAFKEAGEVEYTAYTALLLYGLPDDLQAEHGLTPGIMSNFRPMALDLVKNREGDVGQIGTKWLPARGDWRDAVSLKASSQGSRKRGRL